MGHTRNPSSRSDNVTHGEVTTAGKELKVETHSDSELLQRSFRKRKNRSPRSCEISHRNLPTTNRVCGGRGKFLSVRHSDYGGCGDSPSFLEHQLDVAILVGLLALVGGHEFPRGGRIRFPFEGPPPFGGDIFLGPPRIYGAESQSHPAFHETTAKPNFNHNEPFNVYPQKPSNVHPFGEVGPHGFSEGIITKPFINQHRSHSRPRENHFHETQPPPFVQPTKLRGVLNVPPPPPPPTSLTAGTENDLQHQRHRFAAHRDPNPNSRRRPAVPRQPPLESHPPPPPPPPIHNEKYPMINERYPPYGEDTTVDAPERHRPIDRPNKGGERYQERNPSEKPFAFKEKAKVPFNGVKKPLFSPANHDKSPKSPRPTHNPDSSPQQDSQEEYYQTKLAEEYYSGIRNPGQRPENPTQTRSKTQRPNPLPSSDSEVYNFNEAFNFEKNPFNIPNLSNIPNPTPFPQSMFPQSGEFQDFFDSSMPEWMNDYKPGSAESYNPGQRKPNQKLTTQETQRTHYKQPQGQKYFESDFSYEQGQNKYVKRNPSQNQGPQNSYYDSSAEYDERQPHQKAQNTDGRPQQESSQYYDSQEFDFGSSSEFSMPEFSMGSFNFGPQSKSSGNEWIPINAPDGAIPAKSYEIPAPDLSQEFYHSSERQGLLQQQHHQQPQLQQHQQQHQQHQQQHQQHQQHHTELRPTRKPSSRADKPQETGNVVYGAREKKRQNEGVVSASVMVKQ